MLEDVEFSRIPVEEAAWLDRPFDDNEVFGVIQGFNGDKALGSDGLSMVFF